MYSFGQNNYPTLTKESNWQECWAGWKSLHSIKILNSSLKIPDLWNRSWTIGICDQFSMVFSPFTVKISCPYTSLEIDSLLQVLPDHSKTTEREWIHLHQDLVPTSLPKTLSFPWITSCTITKSGLKCALYKTATLVQKLDS